MSNTNIPILLSPDVVMYIGSKCRFPPEIIQKKLLDGDIFDIKGQGADLDTHIMQQVLKQNQFYQNPYQKLMKDDATKFVKKIVQDWSIQIAKNQIKISKDQIPNYIAKALPYGSYVLDLRSNSSDVDLVCVCPNFINRQVHFFKDLVQKLQQQTQVTGISARMSARVPIITFDYKQINIDLSFCQLASQTVPRDIQKVIGNQLVNSIPDKKSQTAILGRKNNLMILQLVGKQVQNFKQTLRVIKVWAKNRGISSNGMGYLGGISWAILLAKICQIFPNHKPYKLLTQFFIVYSIWNWKQLPIQLLACQQPQQRQFLMCVMTPGNQYNSTQRVNQITFKVLIDQIRRANQILLSKKDIRQVCKKPDFLNLYPVFIEMDICGDNQTKQQQRQYKDFQGNVQSKILNLLQSLLRYNKKDIQEGNLKIVPNPKLYKKQDPDYPLCYCCFFGIDVKTKVQMGKAVRQWTTLIDNTRSQKTYLNLRVFKTKRQQLNDVQINEAKKKQEKKDPRLDNRTTKKATVEFFKSRLKQQ